MLRSTMMTRNLNGMTDFSKNRDVSKKHKGHMFTVRPLRVRHTQFQNEDRPNKYKMRY